MNGERDASTLAIDVLRGAPTEDELAGLIAVVSESYAGEAAAAVADDASGRSAWALSTRALRRPLRREFGWGGFSG